MISPSLQNTKCFILDAHLKPNFRESILFSVVLPLKIKARTGVRCQYVLMDIIFAQKLKSVVALVGRLRLNCGAVLSFDRIVEVIKQLLNFNLYLTYKR